MTRKGSKKKMQPESLTPPPPPPPANGFSTTSTSTFGTAAAPAAANPSNLLDRARLAGLLDVGASWVDSASNSPLESPLVERAAWQEERLRAENRELREKLVRVERELKRTTAKAAAASSSSPSGSPLDQRKNRRWTMMHVAVAFVAGVVFVFADTTWGENRFLAGGLYTLGTVLLLFAVPALHATGLSRHVGYRMWQPFRGGLRFVVLQAFTWAFYTLAVLAVLGAVLWEEDRAAGLLSSGGVLGILSQVLMASSLQTFVAPQDDEPLGLNERVKVSTLCGEGALDQLGDTPFERMQSELMQSFSDEGPLSPVSEDGRGGNVSSAAAAALLGDGAATLPSDLPPVPNKMDSFAELLTLNFLLILIMGALAALSEVFDAALPAALSLLVTAVAVLLTHGLGGKVLRLQGWTFFQPFSGGTQFIVLQGVTWMLFTISILCQMAFLYAALYLGVKLTFGLMHVGGVAALCSEVLCVLSFRYFKGKGRQRERAETTLLIRRCDSSRYLKGHKEQELRERRRAVEEEEERKKAAGGGAASAADAAGKKKKKKKQGGGKKEVVEEEEGEKATKTLVADENLRISSIDRRESWLSLFTIIFVWNIMYIPFVAHLAVAAIPALVPDSVADVVAPYCYGVFYRGVHWSEAMWTASYPLVGVLLWVTNFSAMQTLGAPRVVSACLSPPWVLLGSLYYVRDSNLYPLNLLLTVIWAAYGVTYLGNPDRSSKRKDERWVERTQLWDTICEYFAGRVLLSESLESMVHKNEGPADAANQYLLGYHPHGIIPSGMVWGMRCAEWREKLPNLKVTGLTASVMHYVPLMRDLLHWTGIREVSRRTLLSTLDEGHSPVVVVGGQAEMFLSRSRDKAIKIVRHHNGFFKIAQEKQLPIIPIFAFGETKIYDNIELPTMQRWFKDRLGFPIPFFLIGRWNLPIPRRKQLILTVGHPVYPRPGAATDAEVHRLKHEYFDAVQGLFDEFKGPAGYDDHVLEFVDKK